ncbi:hypothetical protein [Dyadobacter frigoris]|uniref:Uncharacterized protein n=1 Tax=Dyadobacter frigoris TaxID=2576211 RepID=A0A4V6BJA8_9BACT|nr:hypothetical protein [Dyadobacter frigoris]TKT92953.1 hypothetical protein FDK13_09250 [Dyadobacter frigoris]
MKNLKAIMLILFLAITGTTFAQTATPAVKTTVTKKKTDKAASTTKVDVKTNAVVAQPGAKLKKDGTLDKRYAENKNLKKDGTPDKRFKANKKDSLKAGKKP